jgi:hypothetical protein
MSNKRGRASGDAPPPGADDFGRIYGIGAAIKGRLYAAGILTFKELAELSPDDIATRVGDFPGKSADLLQEWINQARVLASVPPEVEPQHDTSTLAEPQHEELNAAIRLHPETFRLELLLHNDNTVHHILVTHHQSEDKGSFASWEEALDFIVSHARLRLPVAEPLPALAANASAEPTPAMDAPVVSSVPAESAPEIVAAASVSVPAEPAPAVDMPIAPPDLAESAPERVAAASKPAPAEPALVAPVTPPAQAEPAPAVAAAPVEPSLAADEPAPVADEPAPAADEPASVADEPAPVEVTPAVAAPAPAPAPAPQPAVTSGLVGEPHLRILEAVPAGDDEPSRVLRHDQPFGVRLTFDLADVAELGHAPLDYTAAIYAKSVSSRSHQTLGEAHGAIAPAETVIVNLEGKTLTPGIYRLEAVVALTRPSDVPARPRPTIMIESGVLQVY